MGVSPDRLQAAQGFPADLRDEAWRNVGRLQRVQLQQLRVLQHRLQPDQPRAGELSRQRPASPAARRRVQVLIGGSRFTAVCFALALGGCAGNSGGPGVTPDTAAFLDTLQHRTFNFFWDLTPASNGLTRSEEHTSELQSPCNLVCRL